MMTFVEKENSNTLNTSISSNPTNRVNLVNTNNERYNNIIVDKLPDTKAILNLSSPNDFSLQSTFCSSKNISIRDSPNINNNISNLYDLDSMDNKNYLQNYSNCNLNLQFYPQNNINCDMMNTDRDIQVDDGNYGSFMWNFEDYFTI